MVYIKRTVTSIPPSCLRCILIEIFNLTFIHWNAVSTYIIAYATTVVVASNLSQASKHRQRATVEGPSPFCEYTQYILTWKAHATLSFTDCS